MDMYYTLYIGMWICVFRKQEILTQSEARKYACNAQMCISNYALGCSILILRPILKPNFRINTDCTAALAVPNGMSL